MDETVEYRGFQIEHNGRGYWVFSPHVFENDWALVDTYATREQAIERVDLEVVNACARTHQE